jgi:hypothetical protein
VEDRVEQVVEQDLEEVELEGIELIFQVQQQQDYQ